MGQRRFHQGLIAGILVTSFFMAALCLRVFPPYNKVFVGDWIKLTGIDAYFFMRLVDNLANNFPRLMPFDPYLLYPGGSDIAGFPTFFVYLLAAIVWFLGLGSPTQHTTDIVGVYFPAVLGALVVIPVYFIGKALFNRWAGVISAGLVAILPGEFLGRSILGFTDYHVAEVLFTTVAMLFLILATKSAKDKGLTFQQMRGLKLASMARPAIYSLLAGIFLGIYFLTWQGALLFVFIIFVYLIVQFIFDHLKRTPTEYLCFISAIVFVTTLLICLAGATNRLSLASLVIAIIIPITLAMISGFMARRDMNPALYPAALAGVGILGLAIFYGVNSTLLKTMLGHLGIFSWPIGTPVLEMQPLMFPGGHFSLAAAWGNFTTSFFLSLISLGILIYFVIKRSEADKTLLLIWSLVILAATLSMRRFAYYYAVNAALLAGYISWLVLEFSGFKIPVTGPSEILEKQKQKTKQKRKQRGGPRLAGPANMALAIIAVFFVVFFPNIGKAEDTASQAAFAPSDGWCESLDWLKNNSPEPFGNPDFYYALYEKPFHYPETAYCVTAWWDYGYWITRIGRRIPTSNPGTHNLGEASLFIAQDEASANRILEEKWNSKYIIVDYATAMTIGGKFHALATYSGSRREEFYDVYYQPRGNVAEPVLVFYPEYYRSLVVRLYNFDGKRIVPRNCTVISYRERLSPEGQKYKEITGMQSFSTYGEAKDFIAGQKTGMHRIVGTNPFVSPVPLEKLEHYKLVYSSKSSRALPGGGAVPEVKIFEYVK